VSSFRDPRSLPPAPSHEQAGRGYKARHAEHDAGPPADDHGALRARGPPLRRQRGGDRGRARRAPGLLRRGRRAGSTARGRAPAPRDPTRRPRRHLRLEHAGAPGSLSGGALHGRRPAHAQHPPLPRAARLRGQPRRGPRGARRRVLRPAAGARGARAPDGRALRRHRRRRRRAPRRKGPSPRRAARRRGVALRLARARRAGRRRDVLHERHDGEPEGRRLQPPLDRPALARRLRRVGLRAHAARPRPPHRADVPRQRLGPPLRGLAHGGGPADARALPPARAALPPDRRGARHRVGRRAHHLERHRAVGGDQPDRPLLAPARRLRRLRRPTAFASSRRGA